MTACNHEWVRAGEREASLWLCLQCGATTEDRPTAPASCSLSSSPAPLTTEKQLSAYEWWEHFKAAESTPSSRLLAACEMIARLQKRLGQINGLACYASEESPQSRESVLIEIGKLARGEETAEWPVI